MLCISSTKMIQWSTERSIYDDTSLLLHYKVYLISPASRTQWIKCPWPFWQYLLTVLLWFHFVLLTFQLSNKSYHKTGKNNKYLTTGINTQDWLIKKQIHIVLQQRIDHESEHILWKIHKYSFKKTLHINKTIHYNKISKKLKKQCKYV